VVPGVVLACAQLAGRRGPAAHRVVTELEASLTVGGGVFSNVLPERTLRSVEGQERMGFVALLGDPIVCLHGHYD